MVKSIKVGNLVVKHFNFLNRLARARSYRKRLRLIQEAKPEQILAIVEIALNILAGDFDLKTRQLHRLVPYAEEVRQISRVKSDKSARSHLIQNGEGAFLPALLLPVLIEAARYLIK